MSQILVDTHAFIWFVEGNKLLSREARRQIEAASDPYLSMVSVWEIAIKISIDKLKMKLPFERLQEMIDSNGFKILPIQLEHTQLLINLPFHHKDPFDRLIIAQAMQENLPLISIDGNFEKYQVDLIW
ncbi:type II toxin-antitoxin system VapC family toxin [Flexithrix dorotheae]|uniref:type II toxin-antitoxin system VapC family toxin n=1 Tax=Flexithrix dorotheae TaxID=70993 RepID=UPI000368B670|nr:type II toxin-antitoxin system VapC family toxin [Flexithrix dorotheae]